MQTYSISELLIEKSVEAQELARLLQISPSLLSRYIHGKRKWPLNMEATARYLLESGQCQSTPSPLKEHFVLVADESVRGFRVFHLYARNKKEAELCISNFYAAQGWDYEKVSTIQGFPLTPHLPLYLGEATYTAPALTLRLSSYQKEG